MNVKARVRVENIQCELSEFQAAISNLQHILHEDASHLSERALRALISEKDSRLKIAQDAQHKLQMKLEISKSHFKSMLEEFKKTEHFNVTLQYFLL